MVQRCRGDLRSGSGAGRDYFGRFEQNLSLSSYGTGWESDHDVKDFDFLLRLQNPVGLRSPGLSQMLEAYNVEGRFGGSARVGAHLATITSSGAR